MPTPDLLFTVDIRLLLTALLGVLAGGYATASGGGKSMVTVPALTLLGYPPLLALSVSRWSAIVWGVLSISRYARLHRVDWFFAGVLLLAGAPFAILGALVATRVPTSVLDAAVAVAVLLVAGLQLAGWHRHAAHLRTHLRLPQLYGASLLAPVFAFYGGLYGAGNGMFIAQTAMRLWHLQQPYATGSALVLGAMTDTIAAVVLLSSGFFSLPLFLALTAGEVLGGYFSADYFIRHESVARITMLVFTIVLGAVLLVKVF